MSERLRHLACRAAWFLHEPCYHGPYAWAVPAWMERLHLIPFSWADRVARAHDKRMDTEGEKT